MACEFLNKSVVKLATAVSNKTARDETRNWVECYKGLEQYASDEDMAKVRLFLDYPEPLLQCGAVFTIIFMILGIPGNLITIISLTLYKKIRNATAFFIISLSCSDLLYTCIIFPITAECFLIKFWTSGKIMCQVFPYLNYSLSAIGLFTIMAITVNRYIMVTHPIHYPRIYKSRNVVYMVVGIWVGSFIMLMPVLFEVWGRFSLDPRLGYCTIIPDKNGNTPKTMLIVMSFVIPSIFIITCYSRIMYIVRKSTAKSCPKPATSNFVNDSISPNAELATRELTSSDSRDDNLKEDVESNARKFMARFDQLKSTFKRTKRTHAILPTKRDKRLQTMISAIMISFFVLHLPNMITMSVKQDLSENPYGNMMGCMLLFVTTCSNPVIYVVMSNEYRQAYKYIFLVLKKRVLKIDISS